MISTRREKKHMDTILKRKSYDSLPAGVVPEVLRHPQAAMFCGISIATWFRKFAAGQTPGGVSIGRCRLFRREDLSVWLAAGCPDRETFEAIKATKR